MLKQTQSLKQKQKLSPLQIQAIKMLELTALELEESIEAELEDNPALEEEKLDNADDANNKDDDKDEASVEDSYDDVDDGIPEYKLQTNNYSKDSNTGDFIVPDSESFQLGLLRQLSFRNLSEHQYNIGVFLIGSIDDDGYLRRDLDLIRDDIAFKDNVDVSCEELEEVLSIIQEFDPVGVGSQNLRDCLITQLRAKPQTKNTENAQRILLDMFDDFTKKHYQKIMDNLGLSEVDFKKANNEIIRLNPKPGSNFSDEYSDQGKAITPDFVLDIDEDGNISIVLNNYNIPDLKISSSYAEMANRYTEQSKELSERERETSAFIKQKVESARAFIDAIKQRHSTLLAVMEQIVEVQREYLLSGDEAKLKPMILKDVADRIGFDVSTVSRVLSGKYLQTNFGIIPMRQLFSEAVSTSDGEGVSSREVKKILFESIENEDKLHPLTDSELELVLKEKGYVIARRTVAKYREQMNIPVARLRKEI